MSQNSSPVKIVVTDRGSDYHACPDGEPTCWAAGKTVDDAIGNLVRYHPERFNVTVEIGSKSRWREADEARAAKMWEEASR